MNEPVEFEAGVSQPEEQQEQRDLSQIPPIEVEEDFLSYIEENDSLDVKLTTAGARLNLPNGRSKNISLKGLAKAMSDDVGVDTGFLPLLGSNYAGIRRYIQFSNKHILLLEASPGKRKVRFETRCTTDTWRDEHADIYTQDHDNGILEIEGVCFPTLIMAVSLEEEDSGRLKYKTSRMYASKIPVFNDDTQLYKFPFGNVYADNRICWGEMEDEVRGHRYNSVLQAGGLLERFMSSYYNRDLFSSSNSHLADIDRNRLQNVFSSLVKDHTEYPVDTLKNAMKVNEVISLLKNN